MTTPNSPNKDEEHKDIIENKENIENRYRIQIKI
jgi:hypothetical protein